MKTIMIAMLFPFIGGATIPPDPPLWTREDQQPGEFFLDYYQCHGEQDCMIDSGWIRAPKGAVYLFGRVTDVDPATPASKELTEH